MLAVQSWSPISLAFVVCTSEIGQTRQTSALRTTYSSSQVVTHSRTLLSVNKRVCCQRNQVHAGTAMARCKNVTAMLSSVCATIKTTDAEQAIPESLNRNEVRADAYPPTTSKNQVRSNGKRATTQQPTLPDETSNNRFL